MKPFNGRRKILPGKAPFAQCTLLSRLTLSRLTVVYALCLLPFFQFDICILIFEILPYLNFRTLWPRCYLPRNNSGKIRNIYKIKQPVV